MRNHRTRLAISITAVLVLTCIALALLPDFLSCSSVLWAQDGPGPRPNLGPPPTAIPNPNPAPTRGRRQVKRAATPTPTPAIVSAPTAEGLPVTEPGASQLVEIGGEVLAKVNGDRLIPVLYGLTESRTLYRSDDSGKTWHLMAENVAIDEFIVSPADPMVLYAGMGIDCGAVSAETQPFLRSGDGGVTWTRLPIGDNLTPLLAHPQDSEIVMAADCTMPYISSDGGERWLPKRDWSADSLWRRYRAHDMAGATQVGDLPASQANWHYLYAAGTDADGSSVVAYSGDHGDAWTRITPRVSPEPRGLAAMVADPTTPGRLWFADENGVWYTEDFGTSWLLTRAGLEPLLDDEDGGVTALALEPDGTIFVGTSDGLYQGDGISDEWTPVEDDSLDGITIDSLLLTPGENRALWINTTEGVYRLALP